MFASGVEYVVAYGSLKDLNSLGAVLGRDVTADELIPIGLAGFKRTWSVGGDVRFRSGQQTSTAAFLDLTRDPGALTLVVMFRANRKEMKRLIRREKNYAPEDVSEAVRLSGGHTLQSKAVAWCFLGRESYRVDSSLAHIVILEDYLERVISAASLIDQVVVDELHE